VLGGILRKQEVKKTVEKKELVQPEEICTSGTPRERESYRAVLIMSRINSTT